MKKTTLLLLLLILVGLPSACRAVSIPRYEKFEASFTLAGQSGNPFDPAQNDVDVVFRAPDGTQVSVPAFWDGDCWRVRFAPTVVGSYTLSVVRNGQVVTPPDLSASSFDCIPSSDPGFVRVDPNHPQRFVFDNGQPYYPIGMDLAWSGSNVPPYPQMLQSMGAVHMNWARVWMTHWDNKNLEWAADKSKDPPIGTYSLDAARTWDTIIDSATANGVYIQMTLQHHGQYTAHTDPNWSDNPFNVANGGFLQHPDDFFTDPHAIALTEAKYRYIIARWGYSTHLLSFELFNEVQNISEASSHFNDVVRWHKNMADVIRAVDVDHHLITTSFSDPGNPLSNIGLDYDQIHTYTPDILSYFASLTPNGATVPVFVGEWGQTVDGSETTAIHDGIWSSIMAPVAGAGQLWYWDQVIGHNWFPQYGAATGFLNTFNIPDLTDLTKTSVQVHSAAPLADLSFNPPGGWQPFTRTDTVVPSDGSAPDLSGFSYFIQGNYHRDMMPKPLTFALNASQPCQFKVEVGALAGNGAHLVLGVDGQTLQEVDFPNGDKAGNQEVVINVPAGPHTVFLNNTGNDWYNVSKLIVTNYAPAVGALAKGNGKSIVFWVYSRDRTVDAPESATLVLTGLSKRHVHVRLWNTWQGVELPAPKVSNQDGATLITLNNIDKDVAGIVTSD